MDLQQGIVARDHEPHRLRRHVASSAPSGAAWRGLNELLDVWLDETSALHHRIESLWLELDRPPDASLSVFVEFTRVVSAGERLDVVHDVLDVLDATRTSQPGTMDRCFTACPEGAYVSHLGVMLGREVPFLRVNVRHLKPDDMSGYLRSIDWNGPLDQTVELARRLRSLTDAVTVCLDVGETVNGRLGLECHLDAQPQFEPRWQLLLGELVGAGWCTRAKRDACSIGPGS